MKASRTLSVLSGSTIKIIACILMAVDHIGLVLFPKIWIFRAIGRLAFPVFAYFIAEGCRYTRHKQRHFFGIFAVGMIYLIFYYLYTGTLFCSIFLTFSVSILFIYLMHFLKKWCCSEFKVYKPFLSALAFMVALGAAYFLFSSVSFDYGFFGMLAPVAVSIFDFEGIEQPVAIARLGCKPVKLLLLTVSLIPLCLDNKHGVIPLPGFSLPIQYLCLLAIPILCLYNGKAGNKRLKYAFYIFYPLHLALIEAVAMIISVFK